MPKLTLKFKDNVVGEFELETGKSLTIGRIDSNDIVIENLAVSGHHAKIDAVGDGYLLTDLQSKNGSFVNDQQVTSHWLQHNDRILIGKHVLFFQYLKGETRPQSSAAPSGGMDQTMVMDTGQYRKMKEKSGAAAGAGLKGEPIGVLSYLAGGEGEVEITKKLFKIGKSSSSDLVVGGLMMGQTAATISKRPNGYSLSFVEGMTKPKLNGTAVKESVMLKEFDVVEIGHVKVQFVLKS
jgi:hypothetical protein